MEMLYDGSVKMEFYAGRHAYFADGERVYGVTTFTGIIDKSRALIYWATNLARDYLLELLNNGISLNSDHVISATKLHQVRVEQAAEKGTQVHALAELWIKSSPKERKAIKLPADEDVRNGFMAFLSWVDEHKVKFLYSERLIFSKKHRYTGTLDCMFTMGEEKHMVRHLGDFKTSSGVYPEMIFQVTAYENAVLEEEMATPLKKRSRDAMLPFGDKYIMRFDKKTGEFEAYCIPAENHKDDFSAFVGLLTAKKRLMSIEADMKDNF